MKEFLRREWRNQEIPPEVYVAARKGAWKILSAKPGAFRSWMLAPAAPLLLVLLWFALPRATPEAPVQLIRPLARLPLDQAHWGVPDPLPRIEVEWPRAETTGNQPPPRRPSRILKEPDQHHLVMNFVLPRSGVRMIWIKENRSNTVGGEE